MKKKLNHIIPLKKALLWIVLSTVLISGSAFAGFLFYRSLQKKRLEDESFKIVAIVQTGPEKEALKTVYLAELLGLSVDLPTNLYSFDTQTACEKLKKCSLIKKTYFEKIKPGTLYIDYTIRKPVAFLADMTNTAIDNEGIPIPFKPFFPPKTLPSIVLGLDSGVGFSWGKRLDDAKVMLALKTLNITQDKVSINGYRLKQIDVSQVFAESFGKRELVIVLEKQEDSLSECEYYLRLNTENMEEGLENFVSLTDYLQKDQKKEFVVVDLRIPQLAFVK